MLWRSTDWFRIYFWFSSGFCCLRILLLGKSRWYVFCSLLLLVLMHSLSRSLDLSVCVAVDLTPSKAECKRLEKEIQMFMKDDPRAVSMHLQHREVETRADWHEAVKRDCFKRRTRRLLADPDALGVEKPQRVAGGFWKYPRIQWAHGNGWISRTKMNCANPKV